MSSWYEGFLLNFYQDFESLKSLETVSRLNDLKLEEGSKNLS